MSIPKIIHYCWFSRPGTKKEYPADAVQCMKSWERILSDYKIICWDTSNFDITAAPVYVREAYQSGKYAFVSDYVRLWALYNYGGIYLDTDVEIIKNFDDLLSNMAFIGYEEENRLGTCVLATEKGNELFKSLMEYYSYRHFILPNGQYDDTPNPVPITNRLIELGLRGNNQYQRLSGITVYPMDYFCPYNPYRDGENLFTDNTYSNHHFSGSWKSSAERKIKEIEKWSVGVFGKKHGFSIAKIIAFPYKVKFKIEKDGIKYAANYYLHRGMKI